MRNKVGPKGGALRERRPVFRQKRVDFAAGNMPAVEKGRCARRLERTQAALSYSADVGPLFCCNPVHARSLPPLGQRRLPGEKPVPADGLILFAGSGKSA